MAAFSKADIYVRSTKDGELWQGELLSEVVEVRWCGPNNEVNLVTHPLAIICSADCDLTQDHSSRSAGDEAASNLLQNVLLCDVLDSEALRTAGALTSPIWANVKRNKNERYHFLAEVPANADLQGKGFGNLALDFKQSFCVSVSHLSNELRSGTLRRCRLQHPFAQHFAQRFFYYQGRIGLPIEHHAEMPAPEDSPH